MQIKKKRQKNTKRRLRDWKIRETQLAKGKKRDRQSPKEKK